MMWCCLQCSCPDLTWFGSILSSVCLASDFFSKGVDTGKALGASAPPSFPSTFWVMEYVDIFIYTKSTMMHFIDVYNTELYYLKLSKINILYFHCGKQTHCMLSGSLWIHRLCLHPAQLVQQLQQLSTHTPFAWVRGQSIVSSTFRLVCSCKPREQWQDKITIIFQLEYNQCLVFWCTLCTRHSNIFNPCLHPILLHVHCAHKI